MFLLVPVGPGTLLLESLYGMCLKELFFYDLLAASRGFNRKLMKNGDDHDDET